MRVWMLALVLPACGGRAPLEESPSADGESPVLYFFMTPQLASGAAAARRITDFVKAGGNRLRVRPVVLIERYGGLGKLDESSPFTATLRELQNQGPLDIPLYDPEGLKLAEVWGIRTVPAFVLVRRGRAHLVLGSGAGLGGMLECDP